MTSSRPNSSRPALGLREIVFDARPRNQRNLTSRQQSALWGAFCRSPHKTEDPGRLAPDLDRNPIQRLRIAPDPHLAEELPEQGVRGDHMVAAGQQ
ncbi:hypothetical protein [Paracoccus rhizosphaerae]|uniref:Uncharacterized protein n=1 Tax=Paracoccus rhizosphaerae TaxID=1133347 RepID=A0ABV6CKU3_9RHOB